MTVFAVIINATIDMQARFQVDCRQSIFANAITITSWAVDEKGDDLRRSPNPAVIFGAISMEALR